LGEKIVKRRTMVPFSFVTQSSALKKVAVYSSEMLAPAQQSTWFYKTKKSIDFFTTVRSSNLTVKQMCFSVT
jgi:hypothetical protein